MFKCPEGTGIFIFICQYPEGFPFARSTFCFVSLYATGEQVQEILVYSVVLF